ncbi:GNAT family N-acetyltransferase [Methylocystis parvus]|uniref:GNAT family N-acetyltransferase n=1 Tax=Methylocystis parvus TaxID=134 RepID=A0A6B8LVQ5_9HYPH|nr:GNAT family N-acetyltransferase [Methylocystis parvus]QGM96487.1 GNAT family N-acetyltransferase [Methylocystis parvus]WBJ99662.1 GNAT family N-acetyltransferase [Methylocystis parvus OBBP]
MFSRKIPIENLALEIKAQECPEVASVLGAEIAARFGPRDETPLAIASRNGDGALIGGLNGVIHWRWLYIRHLWVAESMRGQGLARRLIAAAEDAARERGAIGAYIDTFDPAVAGFYERRGFARFGEIEDFPLGGRRIYLSKRIIAK